jgi:hypothetical protein
VKALFRGIAWKKAAANRDNEGARAASSPVKRSNAKPLDFPTPFIVAHAGARASRRARENLAIAIMLVLI